MFSKARGFTTRMEVQDCGLGHALVLEFVLFL